jgi:hypothetical protein
MSPETEPTVAVEPSLPRSVLRHLDALAEQSGKDRNGVIVQLVEATKPLALADAVGPVHEEFRQRGYDGAEIDQWAEEEVKPHREGRSCRPT